jgi:hypothetical protein
MKTHLQLKCCECNTPCWLIETVILDESEKIETYIDTGSRWCRHGANPDWKPNEDDLRLILNGRVL